MHICCGSSSVFIFREVNPFSVLQSHFLILPREPLWSPPSHHITNRIDSIQLSRTPYAQSKIIHVKVPNGLPLPPWEGP